MAYIGNTLQNQNYVPAVDYFNGDGSTTAFTLSRPVASVAAVQATISNVPQNPGSAFTVLNNTITFTSAPPSGTGNIYVYYTSPNTSVATISQAPVIIGPEYVSINSAAALGGTTNPIVAMSGSANNYVQSYIYNTTNAAYSSADFVAYPSNGTDSSGWVDMGITGPTYNQSTYAVTGANEGYLFMSAPSGSSTTGNLVIATDSTGTANAIKFCTNGFNSASNERMRIDSSGNVGIGTSIPNTSGAKLVVVPTNTSGSSLYQAVDCSNYVDSNFQVYVSGSSATDKRVQIGPTTNTALTFGTNALERMRIDSSGNLCVNSATSIGGGKIGILFDGLTATGMVVKTSYASTGSGFISFLNSSSATIGSITQNGATTVNYGTSSDYRLKENVQPMQNALATVAQLNPVTYTWKADGSDGQGFIAHELQAVVPDCVVGEKDAVDADGNPKYQAIDTSFLVATLTAAIQELNAKVEAQAAEIAALKGTK